ncbi:MAG TPA: hypothetical protein VGQ86_05330 [Candidatus Limnocylindria bacterium]|nr:hypothetical protein [Candidatus Limnocylindria bacterium]
MGRSLLRFSARAFLAMSGVALVAAPLQSTRAADDLAAPDDAAPLAAHFATTAARDSTRDVLTSDMPLPQFFTDPDAGVSFAPPPGWVQGPASALNPVSDPPEPVFEVARYQIRIGDPQLYAAPIPITSGLIADAGAVISVGIARADSGLVGLDLRALGDQQLGTIPGFVTLDDDAVYDSVHVFTRYYFSRQSDRVVVLRAAAAESDWTTLADKISDSAWSLRADPLGANAPAAPPPPPPAAPEPVVVEVAPDPTLVMRERILSRAASLLGLRYVWGGNSTVSGMDCSAYVSWTWSVGRYTTDSIWQVSYPIGKDELRAGDAMNLTISRDPSRSGHIRLFEAWANAEHTLVWVYEETPPRVVHRVIVYDARYQPIRLAGLTGAGEMRIVPGAPAPEPVFRPAPTATRRPSVTTPRPTVRPTPRPTVRATPRPTVRATVRPLASATPRPPSVPTPRPSFAPANKPRPGATPEPDHR